MMDRRMLFEILYALTAANGREAALFGACMPVARDVFAGSLAGHAFPEVWFEIPLKGEPWFDLHTLVSREDLNPDAVYPPEETGGCPEAFRWFARQDESVRQLALSWDLQQGKGTPTAAVQLLLFGRDPDTVRGFLRSVGREDAFSAYRRFLSRIPDGWFACYTGVFPGRSGAGLRVECIPEPFLQAAYAEDPGSLREHLAQTGFTAFGDTLIPWCRLLAGTPFQIEFQFDIGADGIPGPVLGVSLRFACPPGEKNRQCFDTGGEAGYLMKQVEAWGLADERWRLLNDTGYAMKVSREGEEGRLFCFTAFLKLRWRGGEPLDAKAYMMAGMDRTGREKV